MRFRFCGGLEPPDWVLAEIPSIAQLTPEQASELCQDLASEAKTMQAPLTHAAEMIPEREEAKAVVAVLRFVLTHSIKYDVSAADLTRELEQLGVDKALAVGIALAYEDQKTLLQEQLRSERFTFPHIEKLQWKVQSQEETPGSGARLELSIQLDQSVVDCASITPSSAADKGNMLTFSMDKQKFMALYQELGQAQGLLQTPAVRSKRRSMTKNQSSPVGKSVVHWTKTLQSEHATTKLGARFHFRKLFLRNVDFSQDELEFLLQYLTNETTLPNQAWWASLSEHERLEVVSRLKLQHVDRKEERTVWFSSMEDKKDCILIYGSAEAKPADPSLAPVLRFTEGSVIGNMVLPMKLRAENDEGPETSLDITGDPSKWRHVKREEAFRKSMQHYTKIVIFGPADFLLLTSRDIFETILQAADRTERQTWLQRFGLDIFAGCIRRKTFNPGAILVKEAEFTNALYFLLDGECKAFARAQDITLSSARGKRSKTTLAAEQLLHQHALKDSLPPMQLPIACLGPKSCVGDISMLLNVAEPATIQAVTTVQAFVLAQEDFAKECSDLRDSAVALAVQNLRNVAYDTLGFVLERVEAESKQEQCDLHLKIDSIKAALLAQKPPAIVSSATVPTMQYAQSVIANDSNGIAAKLEPRSALKLSFLPSVVQTWSRKQVECEHATANNCGDNNPARLLIPKETSPRGMTRSEKQIARSFASLQSPVAAKSLGCWRIHEQSEDTVTTDTEDEVQRRMRQPAEDSMLFLVPTMTRQRQLHGK